MAIRAIYCTLNGHELALRLDMGAMAELEDRGEDITEIAAHLAGGKFSAKRLRLLLWAMLQGEETPPTLKEVGRWVDGDNLDMVAEKIGEALALAFPDKPKDVPQSPPGGAGIGEPPSASPRAPSA